MAKTQNSKLLLHNVNFQADPPRPKRKTVHGFFGFKIQGLWGLGLRLHKSLLLERSRSVSELHARKTHLWNSSANPSECHYQVKKGNNQHPRKRRDIELNHSPQNLNPETQTASTLPEPREPDTNLNALEVRLPTTLIQKQSTDSIRSFLLKSPRL